MPIHLLLLLTVYEQEVKHNPIYKENEQKILEKLRTLNDIAHYIEDIVNYGVESDD